MTIRRESGQYRMMRESNRMTALKTLALRLRGAKVELEDAGLETDAMAESTSQLQAKLKALTHGKVDVMLDADTFKSTTEINLLSPCKETYMLCA